jgi:ABC-type sugar transport system ATPase subunit
MGRAIVRRPKVFLFDEPLSNLDAALRNQVRVELRRQHAELRTTTVYVTHDQTEAMTLADRIVVLNGGKVQQVGTPDELFFEPANRFVAGFIGSPGMNFLEELGDTVIGVRPNDVRLVTEGPAARRARVEVVERLGFEAMVHLRLGKEALVARVEELPRGDEVFVRFDREYRFDRRTGERVA